MDKGQAMVALKQRMGLLEPLPDEPHFATSDETIVRFLKSSDWKLPEAEKALLTTVEYRRETQPLRLDCKWCHDRPGYHSMRQVGHDECGRPVIYANFAQASTHKNSVEDIVAHVTYLIENAKATMEVGVTTWVFVIDCTGMTLNACNPKLGYGMANILSNHYPERLGLVICVNHNPMFHGVWKALKKVVSPGTSAKVRLVRSLSKIQAVFSTFFSEELTAWLLDEMELNKQRPLPRGQAEFWAQPTAAASAAASAPPNSLLLSSSSSSPSSGVHDPRGSPAYIRDHVLPFSRRAQSGERPPPPPAATATAAGGAAAAGAASSSAGGLRSNQGAIVPRHRPHPNIADALFTVVRPVCSSPQEQAERLEAVAGTPGGGVGPHTNGGALLEGQQHAPQRGGGQKQNLHGDQDDDEDDDKDDDEDEDFDDSDDSDDDRIKRSSNGCGKASKT